MRHLIFAFLFLAGSAAADERVEALLAEGKYEEATDLLGSALRAAVEAGDRDAQVETKFATARAYEVWADADAERRDEHLKAALLWYERLWSEKPRRRDAEAASRNNAAQIYARFGAHALAAKHFEEAVAVESELRPFYLANYAEFLVASGNAQQAISLYEQALAKTPDDVVTEGKLLRLYPGPRVVEHLWKLVGESALSRAQAHALEQLSREFDGSVKRDLLAVVVATLAQQHVRREEFAKSEVNTRLGAVADDAALRDGIRELRRLYEGKSFEPKAYSWWREETQQRKFPIIEPRHAFSAVASELGEQAAAHEQAERYLTLAIDVTRGRDPEPFIALADLYARKGEVAKLKQLDSRYHPQLLEMKGYALRTGDWRSVHRMHVALGTIYARLGEGGDAGNARSAIFYLERAKESARELSAATNTSFVLDPRSVDLLAKSYAKTEPASGKDLKVRFDAVKQYLETGRTTSAEQVLVPAKVDPRVMQGPHKTQYEMLQRDLQRQHSGVMIERVPRDGRSMRLDEVQRLAVRRAVRLHPPASLQLDSFTVGNLEKLLSDYYSVQGSLREDMAMKLSGFGITKVNEPVGNRGSVVLKHEGKSVTVPFELVQPYP
jgi:tetratricopeptide (TPR) repeat protein